MFPKFLNIQNLYQLTKTSTPLLSEDMDGEEGVDKTPELNKNPLSWGGKSCSTFPAKNCKILLIQHVLKLIKTNEICMSVSKPISDNLKNAKSALIIIWLKHCHIDFQTVSFRKIN